MIPTPDEIPGPLTESRRTLSYRSACRLATTLAFVLVLVTALYYARTTSRSAIQLESRLKSLTAVDRLALATGFELRESGHRLTIYLEDADASSSEVSEQLSLVRGSLAELNQALDNHTRDLRPAVESLTRIERRLRTAFLSIARDREMNSPEGYARGEEVEAHREVVRARDEIRKLQDTIDKIETETLDAILQTNTETNLHLAIIVSLGCALILLSTWATASLLSRILAKLIHGAQAIGRGEYDHRVDIRTPDSLGTLAVAMNDMASKISSQTEEIRTALAETERLGRVKTEFLANMSHEIRTPMTAILGYADLLQDSVTTDVARDGVAIIRRNGSALLVIINDILNLAKLESGQLEMESVELRPVEVVDDCIDLFRAGASEKGLTLQVELESPVPPTLHSDPTRVRQILVNLISNAVKFTQTGTVAVKIGFDHDDDLLSFAVEDTGVGLSEEEMSRIFQPFLQADNSTTRTHGGTGLGLTISKNFAQLLGGDLRVTSTPGEGSRFTLTVSAGGSADALEFCADLAELRKLTKITDSASRRVVSKGRPLEGAKVLFVEDGEDNQRLIKFILEKAGAHVTLAENGAVGLETALKHEHREDHFDLVLTDMQMPVMDGYEATRALRDAGFSRPIIALTANAMSGDSEKCKAAGCDDFCAKPIERDEFLRTVAHHYVTSRKHDAAADPRVPTP